MGDLTQKKTFFGHPPGLFTLFFTEMWERFSYYGMRAILILFMVASLAEKNAGMGLDTATAGAIYGLYTAGVYLLTLPGGWLADNIFGQRKAIWYGGVIIMLGHISLAIPQDVTFYLGLVLVCIGTGLLKANISTIVGDLYPEGGARRDAGFSIFYMGINIGSFLGQLVVGILGENWNWHWGFGAAAVGMFLGLVVYRLTADRYLGDIGVTPKAKEAAKNSDGSATTSTGLLIGLVALLVLFIVVLQLTGIIDMRSIVGVAEGMGYIIIAIVALYFAYILIAGGLNKAEKLKVVVIIFLFIGAALFWSGFEQAGSSLNLFAERHTDRMFQANGLSGIVAIVVGLAVLLGLGGLWVKEILNRDDLIDALKIITAIVVAGLAAFAWWLVDSIGKGWEMPASWLQSVNPMFIILLAPVFGALWVKLAQRNMNPSAPLKFGFGLICLGLGFLVMVFAARAVVAELPETVRVSTLWLVMTYFLHTTGELTLSPVGLSMTTKLAPKKFGGQMMGIWFIGAALGNLIAGLFAGNFDENNTAQMPDLFMSVVMTSVGAGIIFLILSPWIKRWMGDVE
ncbi:MAG: peptide MFS transporter [Lewinella sp.]|nr:peptide MFS transporter [Lewinella sp.]